MHPSVANDKYLGWWKIRAYTVSKYKYKCVHLFIYMWGVYNIVYTVHGKSGKICVCACKEDMWITYAIDAKEFITFSIAGAYFNESGMTYLRLQAHRWYWQTTNKFTSTSHHANIRQQIFHAALDLNATTITRFCNRGMSSIHVMCALM